MTIKTKNLFELFDEIIEYPTSLAEEGVNQGVLLNYVSKSYINGIVNYVSPFFVCVIERYIDWSKISIYDEIELMEKSHHTQYSMISDDVILLAKTENSLWFFWSDQDCSDCSVGRIAKTITEDDFKQKLIDWIVSHPYVDRDENTESIVGNYIELKIPKGWMSF